MKANKNHLHVDNIETTNEVNQIDSSKENFTKISGRVQIYGNEPFTFAGIIDFNGKEYAVYPPAQEEKIRALQGHLIEFTVIFLDEPKGYASLYLKGGTVELISWEIIQ